MSVARIPLLPTDVQALLVGLADSLHTNRYFHGCTCRGCAAAAESWWRAYDCLYRDEQLGVQTLLRSSGLTMPVPPTLEGAYEA